MSERQRILGLDPGSRLTGFGVVDFVDDRAAYVASGSVRSCEGSFAERLRLIFRSIGEITAEYRPHAVVIETVFVHRNAGSALKLGQARSAALCATFERDIEVFEYAPREIKQAVVGTGAATKAQVQHMVRSLLQLEGQPTPDAADALAAALCHGHRRRLHSRLAGAAALAALR
ncbi:MAG TPA: crossover junction endodeoxyribonuclease RuvC [Woeseiaceae bacterium]|nr:crossover junction endodeoxyribonuclease RuvC [Woeseiaceae bacterium]